MNQIPIGAGVRSCLDGRVGEVVRVKAAIPRGMALVDRRQLTYLARHFSAWKARAEMEAKSV